MFNLFAGCRYLGCASEATDLRYHKCPGRHRVDREEIQEQYPVEVSDREDLNCSQVPFSPGLNDTGVKMLCSEQNAWAFCACLYFPQLGYADGSNEESSSTYGMCLLQQSFYFGTN